MTPASALYNYVHDLLAENPHLLAITRQLEQEDTADTAATPSRVSGRRAATTPTTQPAAASSVTSTSPAKTGQNIGRNH